MQRIQHIGKNTGYFDTTDGYDRDWNIDRGDDVEVAESGSGLVVVMLASEWLSYDVTINKTGKYNYNQYRLCY